MRDSTHWEGCEKAHIVCFAHARIVEIEGACDHTTDPTECELEAKLTAVTGLARGARYDGSGCAP